MGKSPYDYDEIAKARFTLALRNFMQTRGLSDKTLGAAVGIDHRTVEKHKLGITWPEYENLFRYLKYFGAAFANELLEPAGITGAFNQDGGTGCPHSVITHLSHTIHIISKAVEDGVIDEQERKDIKRQVPVLKAVLKAFMGGL